MKHFTAQNALIVYHVSRTHFSTICPSGTLFTKHP